ncbi:MAG: hypothetical protein ACK4MU_09270, partial [Thermomonas sp.]
FHASFEGMVRPGDVLHTQLRHVGMRAGRLVVEVETVRVPPPARGAATAAATAAAAAAAEDEQVDADADEAAGVDAPAAGAAPEVVLRGRAEVEQPLTAYVFRGQGSAEKGMGTALYARSPMARVGRGGPARVPAGHVWVQHPTADGRVRVRAHLVCAPSAYCSCVRGQQRACVRACAR